MCGNFDPWGVRLNGTGTVNSYPNRWELQGKEKESTFNLNRVDFGARVYNPTIGRWDKVDPLADQRVWISTYNYVQNNPITRIDPDGAFDDYAMLDDGRVELIKRTKDNFDRLTASNGNEIKINKVKSTDGTIISQLSKEDKDGFSMGTTTNATDARNLYNFMDANSTRGIEFSLTGHETNSGNEYSVSSSHLIGKTSFDKINVNPATLIFHIHNHDGYWGDQSAFNISDADKYQANKVVQAASKYSKMLPRLFISLESGQLREYFYGPKQTQNTSFNMFNINLKNIKKNNRYEIYR